jgi:hypothetical protein
MSKRRPEDILKDIEDSDMDDEIDRVLSLSEDELHGELKGAGFDVDALHAKADALHAKLQQSAPPSPAGAPAADAKPPPAPARLDEARARRARLFAGLALAASVAGLYVFIQSRDRDVSKSAREHAADLRHAAADACDHARWRECLKDLDDADGLDPESAGDARSTELRHRATKALGSTGEHP